MTLEEGLRERKKRQTRQAISDIATRLFVERGFEAVTVAEIAEAANVARMTVANYFPRKEDLFFDREDETIALLAGALERRAPGMSPIAALRGLAEDLLARDHPVLKFAPSILAFWNTVGRSPTLMARRREMNDEAAAALAIMLARSANRPEKDAEADLAAALLSAAWNTAYRQAVLHYARRRNAADSRRLFLGLFDRGLAGVAAAMAGTPYA